MHHLSGWTWLPSPVWWAHTHRPTGAKQPLSRTLLRRSPATGFYPKPTGRGGSFTENVLAMLNSTWPALEPGHPPKQKLNGATGGACAWVWRKRQSLAILRITRRSLTPASSRRIAGSITTRPSMSSRASMVIDISMPRCCSNAVPRLLATESVKFSLLLWNLLPFELELVFAFLTEKFLMASNGMAFFFFFIRLCIVLTEILEFTRQ